MKNGCLDVVISQAHRLLGSVLTVLLMISIILGVYVGIVGQFPGYIVCQGGPRLPTLPWDQVILNKGTSITTTLITIPTALIPLSVIALFGAGLFYGFIGIVQWFRDAFTRDKHGRTRPVAIKILILRWIVGTLSAAVLYFLSGALFSLYPLCL